MQRPTAVADALKELTWLDRVHRRGREFKILVRDSARLTSLSVKQAETSVSSQIGLSSVRSRRVPLWSRIHPDHALWVPFFLEEAGKRRRYPVEASCTLESLIRRFRQLGNYLGSEGHRKPRCGTDIT